MKNEVTVKQVIREKLHNRKFVALLLLCFDVIIIGLAYLTGLLFGYHFDLSTMPRANLTAFIVFSCICPFAVALFFKAMRMYRSVWSFVGFRDMLRFLFASVVGTCAYALIATLVYGFQPIDYYLVSMVIVVICTVGVRFSYRAYLEIFKPRREEGNKKLSRRVMIIGGGEAGRAVTRELQITDKINATPCCIIDDNCNKHNLFIEGVPVVGGREDILSAVKKYNIEQIYFCIPTASPKDRRDILAICQEAGCTMKSLPGMYQIVNDEVLVSRLRPVQVEELLGRDTIRVNMDEICEYVTDKVILVTGGGGSIGSELCRQLSAYRPKRLIIFDVYENNAYQIQMELKRSYPELNLTVLIGSVRDSRRLEQVFSTYRPEIVFHAAAHKHVPLMEDSPNESIKNNVVGTYKTAYCALKYGTKRFVLISTDKAVNPTNVMGASKRLCEMVIQSLDAVSKSGDLSVLPNVCAHDNGEDRALEILKACEDARLKVESVRNENREGCQFVAVRFGNVLGSNGSVIPLFKQQIEEGGPVTVTHPDIVRYFMTIPEAVSLVLQAGAYAWGGEIFVLDMGEPVKIDTLAKNLIRLSGYKVGEDIKIVYSGLRPGEKLYEEKLMAEEGLKRTDNNLIYIGKPVPFEVEKFLTQFEELAQASYDNSEEIVRMVEEIVPTFHPVGKNPELFVKEGNEESA